MEPELPHVSTKRVLTHTWEQLSPKQLQLGRRAAVQYAYQLEMNQQWYPNPKSFQVFLDIYEIDASIQPYIQNLVDTLIKNVQCIDNLVSSSSTHWKFSRISKVDLAVLRICTAECFLRPHLAPDIIIAEAVEIAKSFGSERSGSFVHGVLNTIVKKASTINVENTKLI